MNRPDAIAPERTEAQRLEALREANRIRTARAELKRRLKREGIQILMLALELDTERLGLRDHDLDTMRIYDLLVAAPKIGRVKANRTLLLTRTSPSKTLGGMSERQRRELAEMFRPFTPAAPAFYRAPAQETTTR